MFLVLNIINGTPTKTDWNGIYRAPKYAVECLKFNGACKQYVTIEQTPSPMASSKAWPSLKLHPTLSVGRLLLKLGCGGIQFGHIRNIILRKSYCRKLWCFFYFCIFGLFELLMIVLILSLRLFIWMVFGGGKVTFLRYSQLNGGKVDFSKVKCTFPR